MEGPPQSIEWFRLLQPHLSRDDQLAFAVSTYNYRISLLCSTISDFIKHSHTNHGGLTSQFTSLLTTADALQTDIGSWYTGCAFQPTDLASLHIHNTLRGAFLKLQYLIVLLVSHINSHPDNCSVSSTLQLRRQQCTEMIQLLSSEILNSVPLALGDADVPPDRKPGCWADALRLLWPLMLVSLLPGVLHQQRKDSQQALQRIGRQMGIRLALDNKPPLGRCMDDEISHGS